MGSCCPASVAHVPLISLTHVAWDCWYRKSLETLSGFLSYQTGGQTRLLLPKVPSYSSVHSHASELSIRCTRQMACTLPIYFSCLNEPHRSSHNWFASSDVPTLLLTQVDVLAGPLAAWATMETQRCWFCFSEWKSPFPGEASHPFPDLWGPREPPDLFSFFFSWFPKWQYRNLLYRNALCFNLFLLQSIL